MSFRRLTLIWLLTLLPTLSHGAEVGLSWQRVPPPALEALHALRQGVDADMVHGFAEDLNRNSDGDQQGVDPEQGRPLNFDPSWHLQYIQHSVGGDSRDAIFLLFPWNALTGNNPNLFGVLMVREGDGRWRVGCEFSDWGDARSGQGVRILTNRSGGRQNFRTTDGPYHWHRRQDGRVICTAGEEDGRRGGVQTSWDSIKPRITDALHDFRQTQHPAALAMARNLDGDRFGLDQPDGSPARNFDASRHLLYLERDLDGDRKDEAILLFTWPPLAGLEGFPGVVMRRNPGSSTWRVVCSFHDRGDTAPGRGPRLLASRSEGWRDLVVGGVTYRWKASAAGPACEADAPAR